MSEIKLDKVVPVNAVEVKLASDMSNLDELINSVMLKDTDVKAIECLKQTVEKIRNDISLHEIILESRNYKIQKLAAMTFATMLDILKEFDACLLSIRQDHERKIVKSGGA